MKGKFWIFVTLVSCAGLYLPPAIAQFPPSSRCLSEEESCAYQDFPQENQQINYRTPQQIQQRRVNSIENQCDSNRSEACGNLAPEVEAIQQQPTLQQLRQRQIETLPGR
jgi:hypothetical protein